MKALSVSVLTAVLVSAAAASDEVVISGTILVKDRPAQGQTVTFEPRNGSISARVAVTDERGRFIAQLPTGRYSVQFGDSCESTPYKLELAVPAVQTIVIRLEPPNPETECVSPHAAERPDGV